MRNSNLSQPAAASAVTDQRRQWFLGRRGFGRACFSAGTGGQYEEIP
ncbi:MAG: hypothetical protein MI919_20990 [Holophagales bacterium]|nr:hypothetical protein [Holophagales bacterium]